MIKHWNFVMNTIFGDHTTYKLVINALGCGVIAEVC